MKTTVIILTLISLILGFVLYRQSSHLQTLEGELSAAQNELATLKQKPQSSNLETQIKCSEQARIAFKENGLSVANGATYSSHFNSRLGKCLIYTENTFTQGGQVMNAKNLYDAVEGKPFGTYIWRSENGRKFWEVLPTLCEVESPAGIKKVCHSDDEFKMLTQGFMNE